MTLAVQISETGYPNLFNLLRRYTLCPKSVTDLLTVYRMSQRGSFWFRFPARVHLGYLENGLVG